MSIYLHKQIGVPAKLRGIVWQLAVENTLNITEQLYEAFHARAVAVRKKCVFAILVPS